MNFGDGLLQLIELWVLEHYLVAAGLSVGAIALAVGSAVMLGCKAYVNVMTKDDPESNKRAATLWAYMRPKLLRRSQSPCWFGTLILAPGALILFVSASRVEPAVHAAAVYRGVRYGRPSLLARKVFTRSMDLVERKNWWSPWPSIGTTAMSFEEAEETGQSTLTVFHGAEVVGILLIVVGLIVVLKKLSRESVGERMFGRAAWAARGEIPYHEKCYYKLPLRVCQNGTRIWENVESAPYTVFGPSPRSSASMCNTVGATGGGKGAYLIGHLYASSRVSIVYQDSKGECPAWKLRPEMLRFGIPAKRPKGLPSMRCNPIEFLWDERLTQVERETLARTLANLILPAPKEGSENSWITETAQPLLADGFLRKRWAHLGELADEVEGHPLPFILDQLAVASGRRFSLAGKNVMEYSANELSNNTQPYLSGWARHAFTGNDFSLRDVWEKGIYIMSATEDPIQKIPIKLFWNLVWADAQSSDTPLPSMVIIDEAISAGEIPGILGSATRLRDRGISIMLCFQTYAGFEHVYGNYQGETLRRSLVNSIIFLNGLNPKDGSELSRELAKYTLTEKNKKSGEKKRTPVDLLPEADINEIAGREDQFWAVLRGRGISKKGRPVLARLVPMEQGMWNVLATEEEYAAEEERFGHGEPAESNYAYTLTETYRELGNFAINMAKANSLAIIYFFKMVEEIYHSESPSRPALIAAFLSGKIKDKETMEKVSGAKASTILDLVPDLVSLEGAEAEEGREKEPENPLILG